MKVKSFTILMVVLFVFSSCDQITSTNDSPNTNDSPKVNSNIPITAINIAENSISIVEGKSLKLEYSVSPTNTTENYYLSTSNKYVATIDSYGMITGISTGNAIIKIYNSQNTIYDLCTVIVNPKTYYVKEKIIKNNFESYISDVFYLRNEDGSLYKNYMKTNIIVIKILFTNNRLKSVPIAPSFFTLINNYDQHNHCYSYGYDPDGKFVSLNDRFDMVSGTSRTMYFAFCDYSEIVNSNYRINCENNHNYDFNVSFSLSEIR